MVFGVLIAVGGDDLDRDEHAAGQVFASRSHVGRESRGIDDGDVRDAAVPDSVRGGYPGRDHSCLDPCPGRGGAQRGLGVIDNDLVAEAVPGRHEHPPVAHLVRALVRGEPYWVVKVVHGVRSETPVVRDAHAPPRFPAMIKPCQGRFLEHYPLAWPR